MAEEAVNTNLFMRNIPLGYVNDDIGGLIISVRKLEERIEDENLTGQQVKAEFAEIYSQATLFSEEMRTILALNNAIRNWLNKHVASLLPHLSR